MTNESINPEVEQDDEDLPDVHLTMENQGGEEVTIRTEMLGLTPYILIRPDSQGDFDVRTSGTSPDEAASLLGYVLGALMDAENLLSEETKEAVIGFISDDEVE